jgi:UDP-N-acetylglucosamine--N-acetylmuramyl-(pentapeptide) pyrophosphoryl-undecaprenol N-acetylglucosamine transferase
MRILLSCDKTKGHFFPAFNLAFYLRQNFSSCRICFQGLKREDVLVARKQKFENLGLDIRFRSLFLEGFIRFIEAVLILLFFRPQRVVGFGGRNSFFIILVCRIFFIPVFIFEPNSSFGRTNRVLELFACKVFTGLKKPGKKREVFTGVPLRNSLIQSKTENRIAKARLGLQEKIPVILVFGGSLGSLFINRLLLRTFIVLRQQGYRFGVIHLTGKDKECRIKPIYEREGIKGSVFDFYEDIGSLYSAADLIVSRSGASTIAEICFFGKPAVLIPYPYAYGHQADNAYFLAEKEAALVRQEEKLNQNNMFDLLKDFLDSPYKYDYLGINAARQRVWATTKEFSERLVRYVL